MPLGYVPEVARGPPPASVDSFKPAAFSALDARCGERCFSGRNASPAPRNSVPSGAPSSALSPDCQQFAAFVIDLQRRVLDLEEVMQDLLEYASQRVAVAVAADEHVR